MVAPLFGQSLSKDHKRWIERDVSAIITRDEARLFERLPSDSDRDLFQQIFWQRRDPNLGTPTNEFRSQYDERIEIANERLQARRGPGYRTDMGQIFLLFGFPTTTGGNRAAAASVSGPTTTASPSARAEGSTSEYGAPVTGGANPAQTRVQTWTYAADRSLGLPDGLELQFRARPSFGYQLVETEALSEVLESRRQSLIAHPDIRYDVDSEGHLLPPAMPSDVTRATQILEELLQTKTTSDALGFRVLPSFFRSDPGTTYVPVLFELTAEDLKVNDENELDVTFFGVVTGSDGAIAQRFEERAWLNPTSGARFEVPLQLAPGDYTAHIGILDGTSQVHGTRVAAFQVPSFDEAELQLSSVVLYDRAAATEELGGSPGRAFQFAKVKIEPIGTQAFRQSDSLGLFFYAYGTQGEDVTARYVFFLDNVEKGQTKPQPLLAADGIALGSDEIPLASFAPGNYRVVVQVEDKATGKIVESRTSFKLEP